MDRYGVSFAVCACILATAALVPAGGAAGDVPDAPPREPRIVCAVQAPEASRHAGGTGAGPEVSGPSGEEDAAADAVFQVGDLLPDTTEKLLSSLSFTLEWSDVQDFFFTQDSVVGDDGTPSTVMKPHRPCSPVRCDIG